MAWQLVAPNQWKNDRSDFTIKFDDAYGSYIVESVDGRFSIPFDDIFNNPVFPIDLSQVTVLGKHFRAEGVNTPGTPGFSFQGDINSGIYRISEDRIGFSAGGIKQGEFGSGYGGFIGNIVQVVSGTNNFQTLISTASFQNINSSAGVVWENSIIPKLTNSRIFILYYMSVLNNASFGGYRISNKVNAGSYSAIYTPQLVASQGAISVGTSGLASYHMLLVPVLHSPSYVLGDTLTYKIEGSSYDPSNTLTTNIARAGGNNGHSEIYILEVAS